MTATEGKVRLTEDREVYRRAVEELADPVWWREHQRELDRQAIIRSINRKRATRYGRQALSPEREGGADG